MKKNKKGGKKMTTLTLIEIEDRVKKNNKNNEKAIQKFESKTKNKNLKKGRVRPKHPTEATILSMFKRKK